MQDIAIVTKYGFKSIAFCAILLLFAFIFEIFTALFLGIFVFVVFIFRNPERVAAVDDDYAVLSPIDGRVKNIEKISFLDREFTAITISKSILNVGTLRSPCDLKLVDFRQRHGLFLCPYLKSASLLNERNLFICQSKDGSEIAIRMVAGAFGKGLYFEKFSSIRAGRRFGFLIDGSVVLMLPTTARISVSVGEKIKGLSVLGFLNYEGKNGK